MFEQPSGASPSASSWKVYYIRPMTDRRPAYLCDAIHTPFGRYRCALSSIRTDDLAALPQRPLQERNQSMDWKRLDDDIYGCTKQAGEDNRKVGRMALLLAGLPESHPGSTVNRHCASSLEAVAIAARAIADGEMELAI